jgi:stearoyl-CoA desaturase (delta-9 desaturase)
MFCVSQFGATGGAHRLWSHRSYKARWPAKVILMYFNTFSFQNDIIEWSRDHRCHHKWTDTDADPHNAQRGLFYSHIGWLMVKKHPEVIRRGKTLDLSDLTSDPILVFQRKYYFPMAIFNGFILTTFIPWYFWGESAFTAFYVAAVFRYVASLNVTFCVNSLAHFIGYKPYDTTITPTENVLTSITTMGEGGHNYHHTFPQDYRTSEFGRFVNWTTALIDLFAALGWVYDRKTVSKETIARQIAKFGPGGHSHPHLD